MTALEQVENLKAARRAELAEQIERAEREAIAEREKQRAAWERDVAAALLELECEWLAEFRGPDRDEYRSAHNNTFREPTFNLPGHYPLVLRMQFVGPGTEPLWKAWVGGNNWKSTWAVAAGTSVSDYFSLADALIGAEVRSDDDERPEPIPF